MQFTQDEIELAQDLKQQGLPWIPSVGHFVWDQNELIEAASPFHDRVFFILDLKHFLRRSKTMESLAQQCCWLPTWHDARTLLRDRKVSDDDVARRLDQDNAIRNGCERLTLYKMIADTLD